MWRIPIVDADGAAFDVGPYDMTFTIKRSTQDSDLAAVWQGTDTDGDIVVIGLTTAGICEVTVPLLGMRTGRLYYWGFQLSSGSIHYTPTHGTILLDPEGNVSHG